MYFRMELFDNYLTSNYTNFTDWTASLVPPTTINLINPNENIMYSQWINLLNNGNFKKKKFKKKYFKKKSQLKKLLKKKKKKNSPMWIFFFLVTKK